MMRLPGDFTPPSRFVRAVAFSQPVVPSKDAQAAILQAFHIRNPLDFPQGATRDQDAKGNIVADDTEWTSAVDVKSRRYFFRTYDSQIRVRDLTKTDLDAKAPLTLSIGGEETFRSLTS